MKRAEREESMKSTKHVARVCSSTMTFFSVVYCVGLPTAGLAGALFSPPSSSWLREARGRRKGVSGIAGLVKLHDRRRKVPTVFPLDP